MCGKERFLVCRHCGNIVRHIKNSGVAIVCCGEEMAELVANTVEASVEKHLPVATISGNSISVEVGSVPHPMADEHYIEFVCVETAGGCQRKCLKPGDEPQLEFCFTDDDQPVAVYAYCNLHGLWKTELA